MENLKKVVKNFSKDGFNVSLLNTECNSLGICLVTIDGIRNTYCMLDESTMFYYISEGEGIFKIDDVQIKVKKGNIIEIPPKHKYTYEGKLKMLEIQSQAFDKKEVHEMPID